MLRTRRVLYSPLYCHAWEVTVENFCDHICWCLLVNIKETVSGASWDCPTDGVNFSDKVAVSPSAAWGLAVTNDVVYYSPAWYKAPSKKLHWSHTFLLHNICMPRAFRQQSLFNTQILRFSQSIDPLTVKGDSDVTQAPWLKFTSYEKGHASLTDPL